MILTIGMIVKNEEEYLENCLASLKPLLKSINSELIIIDTGSTDLTIDIAKKYTDKIYNYIWCDDFAAARNECLKYAKGQWFMFIDADEVLQDANEIIRFFKSNEYKKYNATTSSINDYSDIKSNKFSSFKTTRLFKITNDTHFEGKIYENIKINMPIKSLSKTKFNHYGYVLSNEKTLFTKLKRNIALLLKELEEKGPNEIICNYIGDSYSLSRDYKKAIEFYKQAFELSQTNEHYKFKPIVCANLINVFIQSNKLDEALDTIHSYFNDEQVLHAIDIDILYYELLIYYTQNKFKEYTDTFEKYNFILQKYISKEISTAELKYRPLYHADQFSHYTTMLHNAISFSKLDNFEKAKETMAHPIFNMPMFINMDIKEKVNLEIEIMKHFADYSNAILLYKKYNYSAEIEHLFETFIYNNITERNNFIIGFNSKDLTIKNDYTELMKLRNMDITNNISIKKSIIKYLATVNSFNYDIIYFIFKYDITLSHISNIIPLQFFISSLNKIINVHNDFASILNQYSQNANSSTNNYILTTAYKFALMSLNVDNENIGIDLFEKFVNCFEKYMNYVFNIYNLDDTTIQIYPNEIHFGYYCIKAYNVYKKSNSKEYLKNLKLALEADKKMYKIIDILIKSFEKQQNDNEFNDLANTIKNNIKVHINSGNISKANLLLEEYATVNPNDKDIENIKDMLKAN